MPPVVPRRGTPCRLNLFRRTSPNTWPWGFPAIDRITHAGLGDMILLGGYSSSGKTLLSILMAAALSHVPLEKIKDLNFSESDWDRLTQAAVDIGTVCPFNIHQAAGSTVDDITSSALGRGCQILYVDYVQQLRVPELRTDNPRIDTQTMVELEPGPDHPAAREMAEKGRAVKQANRLAGQVQFQECRAGEGENPFEGP